MLHTESGPPTNLEAKQVGSDSIVLKWQKPDEPKGVLQGYAVQYTVVSEDGQEGPVEHYDHTLQPTDTMIKLTNLQEGSTHRVTVAAINGAGEGEW